MKSINILAIVLVFIFVAGLVFVWAVSGKPKMGGVFINSDPPANVYVNGTYVGPTPYTGTYPPGEIVIRMVPIEGEPGLLPFETRLTIVSEVQTVVRREFATTESESSGDILSFEKKDGDASGLIVFSTPENSEVLIDGVSRGFTPYKTSEIALTEHQLTVKSPGYADRVVVIKPREGYRLSAFVKLGSLPPEENTEGVDEESDVPRVFVEILDTPTGKLRVRTEPGTQGEEIAEVNTGEKYPFLERDSVSGWYKIEYADPKPGLPNGIVGWVSGQYVKVIDADGGDFTQNTDTPLYNTQ